jgi:hypothetical protein
LGIESAKERTMSEIPTLPRPPIGDVVAIRLRRYPDRGGMSTQVIVVFSSGEERQAIRTSAGYTDHTVDLRDAAEWPDILGPERLAYLFPPNTPVIHFKDVTRMLDESEPSSFPVAFGVDLSPGAPIALLVGMLLPLHADVTALAVMTCRMYAKVMNEEPDDVATEYERLKVEAHLNLACNLQVNHPVPGDQEPGKEGSG